MNRLRYFFYTSILPCAAATTSCCARPHNISATDCVRAKENALEGARAALQANDVATPGLLGTCIAAGSAVACTNPDAPLALQSVMKLLVAIAVFDRADAGQLDLQQRLTIKPADLSVGVQPLAKLVLARGSMQFTVAQLVRRMVTESDSAATDALIEHLGGPKAVDRVIARHVPAGIRVDRYERELQSDLAGLVWQPSFTDPTAYAAARAAVAPPRQAAARRFAARDPRDRATPQAMTSLMTKLADGSLLSPQSTQQLIAIMEETRTFPDRLVAGVPPGWRIAHKTGTSRTVSGMTAMTADVGILTAPDGKRLVAVAFLADSIAPAAQRARAIAEVGAITQRYHSQITIAPACQPGAP